MVPVLLSYFFGSRGNVIHSYPMTISRVNIEGRIVYGNNTGKKDRERSISDSAKRTRKQKAAFMSRRRLSLAACLREVCPALA